MQRQVFIAGILMASVVALAAESPFEVNQSALANCESQILANKQFSILKGKLDLLNTANQPIEILANNKKPSKQERSAIALWVEEQKRCSGPSIEFHKSQAPQIGAIFDSAYTELFISAADLYQGKITYGDFAKASMRRHQETKGNIAAVIQQFRAQQQAEKEQREAWERQQQAEQAQRQLFDQQQAEQARREAREREQAALVNRRRQCDLMEQQLRNVMYSGPTPLEVQRAQQQEQEARALAMAKMSSIERSNYSMQMAGSQLGAALGGALGVQNPAMAEAQRRQAALEQLATNYRQNCQ